MARTTISLPDDLLMRVKVLAAERGISMAEFVRQAVEEKAAAGRPKPRRIGIAESTGPGVYGRDASEMRLTPSLSRPGDLHPGPPRSLGIAASGYTTTSEEASDWPFMPRTWRSS